MDSDRKIARTNDNVFNLLPEFTVDVFVDPNDSDVNDHVYRLLNEQGEVVQERTVADDAIEGDDHVTLVFSGLLADQKYTLEAFDGDGEPWYVFEAVELAELIAADEDEAADDEVVPVTEVTEVTEDGLTGFDLETAADVGIAPEGADTASPFAGLDLSDL